MRIVGFVESVWADRRGSFLIADAPVGTTILALEDAVDFDAAGGELQLNGETLTYVEVDFFGNTVTLSAPLTIASYADYDVDVLPAAWVKYARVITNENDEAITAVVSHSLFWRLQDGNRNDAKEAVALELDGRRWFVTDVLGAIPTGVGTEELADDVTVGIEEARQRAEEALRESEAAMNFAETRTRVFRQDDQPNDPNIIYREGDVWIDTNDGNAMYVYWGGAWESADNAALGDLAGDISAAEAVAAQALADALAAQQYAESKAQTFYSATMPTGGSYAVGDIWFDTSNPNVKKIYVYDGNTFVEAGGVDAQTAQEIADAQAAANQALLDAEEAFNEATRTRTAAQDEAPANPRKGDIWYDTDDNNAVYVYSDVDGWVSIGSGDMTQAVIDAQNDANAALAAAMASSKVYIQSTAPVGRAQDLWIDTTNSANTPKRWNGTAWVTVQDKIAQDAIFIATFLNNIKVPQIEGDLDAVEDRMTDAETDISAVETRITTAEGTITSTSGKVTNLEGTVSSHTTRLTDAEQDITQVSGRVDNAEMLIDSQETRIGGVEGDVTEIVTIQLPGKNKVTHSTNPASGPNTAGDIWFQKNATGEIIAQWEGTGGTGWSPKTLNGMVLTNLDAGRITVGTLAAARIGANTIDSTKITTVGLDAAVIKFGTMSGSRIQTGTLAIGHVNGLSTAIDNAEQNANDHADQQVAALQTLWGYPSDSTFIDGGKIYTNSIKANSVAIADWSNYVNAPDFSYDWTIQPGGSVVTATGLPFAVASGKVLRFDGAIDTTEEAHQQTLFNVNPLGQYKVTVYVRKTTASTVGSANIRFRHFNAAGQNVAPHYSEASKSLASMTQGEWYPVVIDATVPADRVKARVDLLVVGIGPDAVVEFAIPSVMRKNGGDLLVDGAIDGKTITGATIQTEATNQRGVKINAAGLVGFKTTGDLAFALTSDGVVYALGPIISAGDIIGSTVTGGLIQTTSAASRGVKLNDSGLMAYDSAGAATFAITASTGAVAMKGALTSGSTVSGATITGGIVQTTNTANRGVKISSTGLNAYNASGAATLTINASTGAVAMVGDLNSGSKVTGAIITGGTIQTESTAARGIKMSNTGLTAFDSAGAATFVITASTGAVAMKGDLLSGSTITGATVTGILQTSTTANRGIKISNSGLTAYDAAGASTFSILGSNGSVVMKGSLVAGSDINGATVTGSVLQTTSTASRGIRINSNGMAAYDSAGNPTFTITASTGAVAMKGTLTNGSSIDGAIITAASISGCTITGGTISGTTITGQTINGGTINGATISGTTTVTGGLFTGAISATGPLISKNGAGIGTGQFIGYGNGDVEMRAYYGNFNWHRLVMTPGGELYIQNHNTAISGRINVGNAMFTALVSTGSGANMHVAPAGYVMRSTSTIKNKTNVRPMDNEVEQLLALEPKHYTSLCEADDPDQLQVGFIAEDAEALGLTEWVYYDEEGEPNGFAYDRWTAALQKTVRFQQELIENLEARLTALENN